MRQSSLRAAFGAAFGGVPAASARAPGRVNWIGEHTDYCGGLVLPSAISRETRVELRLRADSQVRGVSRERGSSAAELGAPPSGDWLDYARGIARELAEAGWLEPRGFELAVESDVPEGAGLSSSAALAAAVALALLAAHGRAPAGAERVRLAALCQRAEHRFAGVPCGLMDPYAVLCCEPGAATLLDCATERARNIALPPRAALLICDTGATRALRDGAYAERRADCEAALAAARAQLGRPLSNLCALEPGELEGLALERRVRARAGHVLGENARVRRFVAALEAGALAEAGAELYASHESLRDAFGVSWPEADFLVERARTLPGSLGARMTGAGFGGCTLHWVESAQVGAAERALSDAFRARFGRAPRSLVTRAGAPASASAPAV